MYKDFRGYFKQLWHLRLMRYLLTLGLNKNMPHHMEAN